MEEIYSEESIGQFSIKVFIKELKKRMLFIVATTLLFAALGGVVGKFFVKTQYTSTATIIVKVSESDNGVTLEDAEKVATIPGISFGADDCLRLSYSLSEADIEEGLARIKRFVSQMA